ncbi:MAG: hypothetical protein E7340_00090 [Clostridiales bacterium]|nr:hypothetical protein [Clostridiales bacterium]
MKEKSKKTVNNSKDDLRSALIKKALGYDYKEVVEEYVSGEEGEVKLAKKKVTKKNVPPDITAIKLLLENQPNVSSMTDEQLELEKERLLNLLKNNGKEK